MTVYYTEYIAYQIYSNIPPQSQRRDGVYAVTRVETGEYHMQMIAL
jgi:hypothetical protein